MAEIVRFLRNQRGAAKIEYMLIGLGVAQAVLVFVHTLSMGSEAAAASRRL